MKSKSFEYKYFTVCLILSTTLHVFSAASTYTISLECTENQRNADWTMNRIRLCYEREKNWQITHRMKNESE